MTHGGVINPFFDWEGDRSLDIPYNESVIYEAHVKGLTQLHPDVPEEMRGTYAGLAHPSITAHLTKPSDFANGTLRFSFCTCSPACSETSVNRPSPSLR